MPKRTAMILRDRRSMRNGRIHIQLHEGPSTVCRLQGPRSLMTVSGTKHDNTTNTVYVIIKKKILVKK